MHFKQPTIAMSQLRHALFSTILVLALTTRVLFAGDAVFTDVKRIVAIGDVHGDCPQFIRALKAAKVIDDKHNWIAGKTHLVQVGDILDRGPTSKDAIDLLMKLGKQAEAKGGKVHCLIGNHEALVMYGKYAYVHPGEFKAFGGKEQFAKAFSPEGKYGQWIAKNNALLKINDYLFVHAGLHQKYSNLTIEQLNTKVQTEMRAPQEHKQSFSHTNDGPLWYRGLAREQGAEIEKQLDATLKAFKVKAIVSGHTVSKKGIQSRFGGKYIMIDTGMSAAYGGTPQALVLTEDNRTIVKAPKEKALHPQ